jgi:UDP-N-acetylmuramate dehydrogenase
LYSQTVKVREQVSLAGYTAFGIGGPARYFVEAATPSDVDAAVGWAGERGLPLFVLGGGSNLLVRDEGFAGLVLRPDIRGIVQDGASFDVGAGEDWDGLVQHTVDRGFAGIECLAGIPGSVGGTPVQNVGAYGQEVAETIESVRALDRRDGVWLELSNADCRFRYRESLFNKEEPERYIVTSVRFRLRENGAPNLRYADLQRRFAGVGVPPTLSDVAAAVREIRRGKGMLLVEGDPDTRSAGSFFKNPVISADELDRIAAAAGVPAREVPNWPAGQDGEGQELVKLSAAWLLERAGFAKGYKDGAAGISSRHTLAIVNRGGASCADIERLQKSITAAMAQRFGVTLRREPVLLG